MIELTEEQWQAVMSGKTVRLQPAELGKNVVLVLEEQYDAREDGGSALERRFRNLVRQWKEATLYTSSITEMATHPAYQQIIGMGKNALPLTLDELRRQPDHWFWALKAITGEDPVAPAARGKLLPMTQAWLDWAHPISQTSAHPTSARSPAPATHPVLDSA